MKVTRLDTTQVNQQYKKAKPQELPIALRGTNLFAGGKFAHKVTRGGEDLSDLVARAWGMEEGSSGAA